MAYCLDNGIYKGPEKSLTYSWADNAWLPERGMRNEYEKIVDEYYRIVENKYYHAPASIFDLGAMQYSVLYDYDEFGQLLHKTDPQGYETLYGYLYPLVTDWALNEWPDGAGEETSSQNRYNKLGLVRRIRHYQAEDDKDGTIYYKDTVLNYGEDRNLLEVKVKKEVPGISGTGRGRTIHKRVYL
jgi:hypothetical protein